MQTSDPCAVGTDHTARLTVAVLATMIAMSAQAAVDATAASDWRGEFGALGIERAALYLGAALLGLGLAQFVAVALIGLAIAGLARFALPYLGLEVLPSWPFATLAVAAIAAAFTLPILIRMLGRPPLAILLGVLVGVPAYWVSMRALQSSRWLAGADALVMVVLLPAVLIRVSGWAGTLVTTVLKANPSLLKAVLVADSRILKRLLADDPKVLLGRLAESPDILARALLQEPRLLELVMLDHGVRSMLSSSPDVFVAAVRREPALLDSITTNAAFVNEVRQHLDRLERERLRDAVLPKLRETHSYSNRPIVASSGVTSR